MVLKWYRVAPMDGRNRIMRVAIKADACGTERLGQLLSTGGANNDRCYKGRHSAHAKANCAGETAASAATAT